MSPEQDTKDILVPSTMGTLKLNKLSDASLNFNVGGLDQIRIEPNGDFFIEGRKAGSDKEVYDGFKAFLGFVQAPEREELKRLRSYAAREVQTSFVNLALRSALAQARTLLVDYVPARDPRVVETMKAVDEALAEAEASGRVDEDGVWHPSDGN
jgi:hypothetical protein